MDSNVNKEKLCLLKMLQIFRKNSDQDHPITLLEVGKLLEQEGLSCSRKTLGRDLKALKDAGYDFIKSNGSNQRGFYLAESSSFETAEVRVLMDAVLSAPFITEEWTKQLVDHLKSLMSVHQAEDMCRQISFDRTYKYKNGEIFYTIDTLEKAIRAKKKIRMVYQHQILWHNRVTLDFGREFSLSPYALLWSHDKYYLACNYKKYDVVSNYRLDRMHKVEIMEEPARPFEEVCSYRGTFDADDYLRHSFYMYNGERQTLLIRCKNSALEIMLDRFGDSLEFFECDNSKNVFTARTDVSISEGLYEWLLQYSGVMTVLSPTIVRHEMQERIRELYKRYQCAPNFQNDDTEREEKTC